MIIEVIIVTGNVILFNQMFSKYPMNIIYFVTYTILVFKLLIHSLYKVKASTFEARIRSVSLYIVKPYNNVVMSSG